MIDTAAQCSSFSNPEGNNPSMLWFITLSMWGPAVLVYLESTLYIHYAGVKVSAVVPQWQKICAQCFCAQLCHHFVNMKCFDPIPEQREILFNVSIALTYWQRGYNPGCSQQPIHCWEMIKCNAFGFNSLESLHHLHVAPVLTISSVLSLCEVVESDLSQWPNTSQQSVSSTSPKAVGLACSVTPTQTDRSVETFWLRITVTSFTVTAN